MLQITPNVRFIGVEDDKSRSFGRAIPPYMQSSISLNSISFLMKKIAIVDSVDIRRSCDWLAKLNYALDGRNRFHILQHVEPDRSGIKALATFIPE